MKLLQPSTLCALFMFFTASASAQLMDDPQLYKMWSDEFGDPNVGFNKPTYNLNGYTGDLMGRAVIHNEKRGWHF
jgi:hypothetical protein